FFSNFLKCERLSINLSTIFFNIRLNPTSNKKVICD
ncbi:unnamed protein product, partial [Brassicogethes aeneus]